MKELFENSKATGSIIYNNMIFKYDKVVFNPLHFEEPNKITDLLSDTFELELGGNLITFNDAQNIKLFVGHNKMLIETEMEKEG